MKEIKNKLYLGDCLDVCDSIPSKSVDLIYLDPPFNSNKNYTQIGTDGEIRHFKDVWKDGVETYCPYMFTRVNALKRILKPTGSILFHCDRYAAAYIRVSILDPIFGSSNFQNELIWYYTNASRGKVRWSNSHDTIFWYTKNHKEYTFNREAVLIPWTSGMRKWRYEHGGQKNKKDTQKGKTPDDIIAIPQMNSMDKKERVGYPTQKPLKLISRLVKVHSNVGDTVFDPFMGSGTTLVASAQLNRNYIGSDIHKSGLEMTEERLKGYRTNLHLQAGHDYEVVKEFYKTLGIKIEKFEDKNKQEIYDYLMGLPKEKHGEFEETICQLLGSTWTGKRTDGGVDGWNYDKKLKKKILDQIKMSRNGILSPDIDHYFGAARRHKAPIVRLIGRKFSAGAETAAKKLMIEAEKTGSPIEIRLLTLWEAVEQYWESASPLNLTVENDTIVAKIIGDYKILNHSWFVKDHNTFWNGSEPKIVKDKKGSQTFSNLGINGGAETYQVVCKAHTDIGDVFESQIEINNLQGE